MTLLIARRGGRNDTHEEPDLPDADTDLGAAEVTVADGERERTRRPAPPTPPPCGCTSRGPACGGRCRPSRRRTPPARSTPNPASLSASKKLLDTKHPALKNRLEGAARGGLALEVGVAAVPGERRPVAAPDGPAGLRAADGELQAELSDAAAEVDAAGTNW